MTDVDFGEQRMGQEPAPRQATLRNVGDVRLEIVSVSAPDEQAGFFLGSDVSGARLGPGEEVSFMVRWLPNRLGSASGLIYVATQAAPDDASTLTATGIALTGALTASPSPVRVGGEALRAPITLTNTGDLELEITGARLEGDPGLSLDLDPGRNGELPLELDPVDPQTGAPSRTIFVGWDPSVSDGTRAGVLVLDNDGYRTRTYEVSIEVEGG